MDPRDFEYFVEQGLRKFSFGRRGERFDAGETAVFSRQLEHVYAQSYDVKRPELKARQLIPVDFSCDPGTELVTFSQFDEFGKARVSHDMATDGPNADIKGVQYSSPVVSLVSSFRYSLQDLRKAKMANLNLDGRKAMAARNAILREAERLACLGDDTLGLYGLGNSSSGMVSVTASSKTTNNSWHTSNGGAGATPDEINNDLALLCDKVFTQTKGVHRVNTVAVGTKAFSKLRMKMQAPSYASTMSVMDFVLASNPDIKEIVHWAWLDTAGGSSKERIVAYDRSPEVLQQIIPQDFEQLPPEARAYSFITNCHMRFGGVQVRYPLAIVYMDGTEV